MVSFCLMREMLYLLIFFTFIGGSASVTSYGPPESSLDYTQEMLLHNFLSYFLKRWLPMTYIEQYVISLEFENLCEMERVKRSGGLQ